MSNTNDLQRQMAELAKQLAAADPEAYQKIMVATVKAAPVAGVELEKPPIYFDVVKGGLSLFIRDRNGNQTRNRLTMCLDTGARLFAEHVDDLCEQVKAAVDNGLVLTKQDRIDAGLMDGKKSTTATTAKPAARASGGGLDAFLSDKGH